MIYLKAEVSTLKERIAKRGRDYESKIEDDYLQQLNQLYDSWTTNYSLSNIVTIQTDTLDFVNNQDDLSELVSQIEVHGLTESIF